MFHCRHLKACRNPHNRAKAGLNAQGLALRSSRGFPGEGRFLIRTIQPVFCGVRGFCSGLGLLGTEEKPVPSYPK
jgi:hypothetical protein